MIAGEGLGGLSPPTPEVYMQTDVSKTKMVAGPAIEDVEVTLEVMRPVKRGETILQPGTKVEVKTSEAKELLSMSVEGQFDFSGERNEIAKKPRLYYYKLVREQTPLDQLAALQSRT